MTNSCQSGDARASGDESLCIFFVIFMHSYICHFDSQLSRIVFFQRPALRDFFDGFKKRHIYAQSKGIIWFIKLSFFIETLGGKIFFNRSFNNV